MFSLFYKIEIVRNAEGHRSPKNGTPKGETLALKQHKQIEASSFMSLGMYVSSSILQCCYREAEPRNVKVCVLSKSVQSVLSQFTKERFDLAPYPLLSKKQVVFALE